MLSGQTEHVIRMTNVRDLTVFINLCFLLFTQRLAFKGPQNTSDM